MCTKDANSGVCLFAFSNTQKENTEGYQYFFRHTSTDFPCKVMVIADGGKGIAGKLAREWTDATLSRCFHYKIENYRTSNPDDQVKRPAVLKLLYGLTRATTEDLWKYLLGRLKAIDDDGKSERIAGWMEEIRSELKAMEFNGRGLSLFDDLLNNPCEISNATILEFWEYPVVRMVKAILQEAI